MVPVSLGDLSPGNEYAISGRELSDSASWLVDTMKVVMGEYDVRNSVLMHFTKKKHYAIYLGNERQGDDKGTRGAPLYGNLATFGKKISRIKKTLYFTLIDRANVGDASHYVGHVYNPNTPSVEGDGTEKVIFILDPATGPNGKYPIFGEDAEEKYSEEVLTAVPDQEEFLIEAGKKDVSWELVPKASALQLRWYGADADTFCQTWSMMLMIAFDEGIQPKITNYTNIVKGRILSNFYKYVFVNILKDNPIYMDLLLRNYLIGRYNVDAPNEKELVAVKDEVLYLLHNLTPELFVKSQSWRK
jgi:hypothetical protein